ncbi:MAG: hypothetical protein LBO69_01735 [Ignavibacteria bacterium]|jgi:hypothetical protein|nr:hypothetical protein [Ignavibacteria bacterium]
MLNQNIDPLALQDKTYVHHPLQEQIMFKEDIRPEPTVLADDTTNLCLKIDIEEIFEE